MKEEFINAIHWKMKIKLVYYSEAEGKIWIRTCAPMDYGPSQTVEAADRGDLFHMWDCDSDNRGKMLTLEPAQIQVMSVLDEVFDPGEFVTLPTNWNVPRDWGQYS